MEINARNIAALSTPYGRTNFIKINCYKNIVANGEELYQTLVDAVPMLGKQDTKDNDTADKFTAAYGKFEEAFKKEFSNTKPAFDKSSTPIDSFYLPLPNSIDESYVQNYEESKFSLDTILAQVGLNKAVSTTGSVVGSGVNMINDVIDLTKHLGARGNTTIDPNIINVYIGSKPRTFTFNIDFMPQNVDEVQNILNIMTKLYKKSLGVKSNIQVGALKLGIIKSAFAFTIDYYMVDKDGNHSINTYLSNMLNTNLGASGFFLSSINYDLGQTSNVQLFDVDGEVQYDEGSDSYTINQSNNSFKVPKVINITLSFVEYRPLYSNDWNQILVGDDE